MLAGGVGRTVAAGAGAAVTGRAASGGGRPREVPDGGRAAAEGAGVKGMDVCVRFDSSDRTTDRRAAQVRARRAAICAVCGALRHRRFARGAAEPMDEVRAVLDRAGLAHLSTKFEEIGYDDVTYLRACATDNSMATSWEEIARECELDVAQEWALSDALLGKPKPKPMPMPKPKPKPAAKAAAKATAKAAAKARPPTPEEPWEETAENHRTSGPPRASPSARRRPRRTAASGRW